MSLQWHQRYGAVVAQGSVYSFVVSSTRHGGQMRWIALYHPPNAPDGAYCEVPGRYTVTRREAMAKAEAFEDACVTVVVDKD